MIRSRSTGLRSDTLRSTDMAPMRGRAYSKGHCMSVILFVVAVLICYTIMYEVMNKDNYGINRSWQKMRRVEKHFFFDLLPSFDLPLHDSGYTPSSSIPNSQFSRVMDRVLLSRYLVDRFAYTSFIQFGCSRDQSIYQLLPVDTVTTRICVDKREGSIRMSPSIYLNSSLILNRKFDLIFGTAELISNNFLQAFLGDLNEGGAIIIAQSNMLKFDGNHTQVVSDSYSIFLQKMIEIRGSYDLDVATLDADDGTYIRAYTMHM